MKRKVNSQSLHPFSKRTPRQDPVSCESCRLKKIKCDRQQPCSSCLARRLNCNYGRSDGAGTSKPRSPAVVERVETTDKPSRPHASPSAPYNRESLLTADWLENIHLAERVSTATPKWLRDGLDDSVRRSSSVNLEAGPRPLLSRPYMSRSAVDENPASVNLVSFLPTKAEALGLFRYYHHYVDYLYHILIPNRVEGHINEIYRCVDSGLPVELNHLALLFSILASSLCLQMALESPGDAEARSQEFVYLTGAALIQSHYTASPTLEGLQATMVVMHNVSNWKIPPLVNGLFVHGAVLELKRRLWWDLTSYDWLMGFLTGPQEWTYLIHPEHMNVNQPINIDDSAIGTRGAVSLPSSTPTDMSFFLQRLKLAFVSREVVDATSYEHLHGLEVSYDKILELDRKFHDALVEIPEFFRLDAASRRRFASLYEERPTIAWQCCLLQQGFYSRLCRLHRDFFIRGAREPAYSYSHVICLQSARKVLEIKRIMDGNEPSHTPPNSVVWSVMHHVFAAAVILLLDVCFNWDDILAEKRKEEVLDACRMLSKAQESSSLVREGINGMMSVLQKHWKHSLAPQRGENPSNGAIEAAPSLPGTTQTLLADPTAALDDGPPDLPTATLDSVGNRQLEDIWSEMLNTGNDLTLEATDWTELLNELTDPDLPRG
ncbi:hypothetical protein ASPCADRAFT_516024 [Aspergillus carbonarius ITEM 5010]|uniref:Zn(2)-C6 fungal-type domain-containing protein n=1 Tax=Aspergillus carbonarius (strain ITEM 5010) TaxID=602072 RepID=A0A1R3RJ97_ASPC5|nr:hypothetical protein ASPCADRAFT_516024 [Aspergillus carbonarius ITEM 5010]